MSLLNGIDELLMTRLIADAPWNEPLLFALWYAKSTLIMVIAWLVALPPGERQRHLGVLPFYVVYVLLQYVPTAVGYLNLLTLRLMGRRLYADHYDADVTRGASPG